MKLIRRELAQELQKQLQDKRLRGVTKKHIVESFQAVGAPNGNRTKTIKEEAIRSLVRMCGHVLNQQEERLLLKKSKSVSVINLLTLCCRRAKN